MAGAKGAAKASSEGKDEKHESSVGAFAEWYGVQNNMPDMMRRVAEWKRLRDRIMVDGKADPPKIALGNPKNELRLLLTINWPSFAIAMNEEVEWTIGMLADIWPNESAHKSLCWKTEAHHALTSNGPPQKFSATSSPLLIQIEVESNPDQFHIVAKTKTHGDTLATFIIANKPDATIVLK